MATARGPGSQQEPAWALTSCSSSGQGTREERQHNARGSPLPFVCFLLYVLGSLLTQIPAIYTDSLLYYETFLLALGSGLRASTVTRPCCFFHIV